MFQCLHKKIHELITKMHFLKFKQILKMQIFVNKCFFLEYNLTN